MFQRLRSMTMFAAALIFAGWATAASAADYLIMAEASNGFARVHRGTLHANGHADNAMRFELVRLQGGRVAFRAPDGTYLRAGVGQETLLATGSPHIRGWETFEIVNHDGAGGLRSVQNGRYVEVDTRTGRLSATGQRFSARAIVRVVGAPSQPVQQPRVEWTGRWSQIWLASPNGNMHRPPEGSRASFTISAARNVEMTAGCNTVHARLSVEGSRARFQSVTSTRMRCSNAQQGYEQGMSQALSRIRSFEFREGQVAFLDADGRTLVQIAR